MKDFSFMTCLQEYGSLKGNRAPNNTRSNRRTNNGNVCGRHIPELYCKVLLKKRGKKERNG